MLTELEVKAPSYGLWPYIVDTVTKNIGWSIECTLTKEIEDYLWDIVISVKVPVLQEIKLNAN